MIPAHDLVDLATLRGEIARVESARAEAASRPVSELVGVFDAFAARLATPDFGDVEGIAFLATWLKARSLTSTLSATFGGRETALDAFIDSGTRKLRAAPRGVVAHWIAGNIPTLALFSFVLSALVKNVNLIRVPRESLPVVRRLLAALAEVAGGPELLAGAAFFYYPGADRELHATLSRHADARVVWGGRDTLATVLALPRHEHCEDVVFGPKFSLGVVDAAARARLEATPDLARAIVRDVVLFDQTACSSPHTLYVEGTLDEARAAARAIAAELERHAKRAPKRAIAEGTAAAILRARTDYALSEDRDVFASPGADWTVLVDADGATLSDGIQSRTLFVRALPSLLDVAAMVTPNVQTVGMLVDDAPLAARLAEALAPRGISRLVRFGLMNVYDQPWDGMFACDRLIRWIAWT